MFSVSEYAEGTKLVYHSTHGIQCARVMCSDGLVRGTHRVDAYADTFFSVPATVRVNRKNVTGYIFISTVSGSDVSTDDDPAVLKFRAYTYGKNAAELPEGEWKRV